MSQTISRARGSENNERFRGEDRLAFYVLFSCVFGLAALFVAYHHWTRSSRFDFLLGIAGAYVAVFVMAPTVLYFSSPDAPAFFKFKWMQVLPVDLGPYIWVASLVVMSSFAVYIGYLLPRRTSHAFVDSADSYFLIGLPFLIFGILSFVGFLEIVGGPRYAFEHAWDLRSGTPDTGYLTNFAFVKRLSFFVVPGSVFLLQAASRSQHQRRLLYWTISIVGVLASIAVLVFMQGRLSLAAYTLPLLLAMWSVRRQLDFRRSILCVFAVIGIFGAIFVVGQLTRPISIASLAAPGGGKLDENSYSYSAKVLGKGEVTIKELSENRPQAATHYLPEGVTAIGLEFAFPFFNILSVIKHVPHDVGYRWFSDLVLPFLELVPKRIFPLRDHLPPRLFEINTQNQVGPADWGIPVDLITFGWFCLGSFGVAVISFGFGYIARHLEMRLPEGVYGDEVLRYSWLILSASLVMYGPDWFVIEMFHWWVALAAFWWFCTRKSAAFAGYRNKAAE